MDSSEIIERIEWGGTIESDEAGFPEIIEAIEVVSRYIAYEPESEAGLADPDQTGGQVPTFGLHSILDKLVELLVEKRSASAAVGS